LKVQDKGPLIGKSASVGAQFKCLYTNVWSTGNKQKELQACVCLGGYDSIGITEMWCDDSHNWNVGIDAYKLLRKDKQGRRGSVALYIKDHLEFMELHLGIDKELSESLWVSVKGMAGEGDIVVGVCYKLPDEEEQPSINR